MTMEEDDFAFPVAKRQRLDAHHEKEAPRSSRLFAPFRVSMYLSQSVMRRRLIRDRH